MTIRLYTPAASFKQALEQRLRTATRSGPDFARRRQLLVFDRRLSTGRSTRPEIPAYELGQREGDATPAAPSATTDD